MKKEKKPKRRRSWIWKWVEPLMEGLLELLLMLVLGGIGYGVLLLLGKTSDFLDIDLETLVMIGIGFAAAIGLLVFFGVKLFKKIRKKIQKKINEETRGQ